VTWTYGRGWEGVTQCTHLEANQHASSYTNMCTCVFILSRIRNSCLVHNIPSLIRHRLSARYDPNVDIECARDQHACLLSVPIFDTDGEGEVIGVVQVLSQGASGFDRKEEMTLEGLAQAMAESIEMRMENERRSVICSMECGKATHSQWNRAPPCFIHTSLPASLKPSRFIVYAMHIMTHFTMHMYGMHVNLAFW